MNRQTAWQRVSSFVATAVMACFGFTGFVSADSITNTGPGSHNSITTNQQTTCTVRNDNDVSVANYNNQQANSGDATSSFNTNAYWSGWDGLNPATAQADGQSFSDWWSQLNNWVNSHSDANMWSGTSQNTSWMPSGNAWQDWNPINWQTNDQSFSNWANQLSSWLNSNAPVWMMNWATGDGSNTGGAEGATSGDVRNNNSVNFSIHISNSSGLAAPLGLTNNCGQPVGGGSGGGSGGGIGNTGPGSTNTVAQNFSGNNGFTNRSFVGGGFGNSQGAYSGTASSARNTSGSGGSGSGPASNNNSAGSSVGIGGGGSGGSGGGGSSQAASISNTGPGSTNVITSNYSSNTSVSNDNNVSVWSSNTQTASTGNASSSYNTGSGGAGSGDATNGNNAAGGVDLYNY